MRKLALQSSWGLPSWWKTRLHVLGGAIDHQGRAYTTSPVWDRYGWVGRRAAQISFEQCGLTPADVDVATAAEAALALARLLGPDGPGHGRLAVLGGDWRVGLVSHCTVKYNMYW